MKDLYINQNERIIMTFSSPYLVAESLASAIVKKITELSGEKQKVTMALPGGNTPVLLFSVLADHYSASADWSNVHFFWIDERCVPPDDSDSNFRMAKASFLERMKIPDQNIHRIKGENDPVIEAARYSGELQLYAGTGKGLPRIDIIILGMGDDGHVASIFPGNESLFTSDEICKMTLHPVTGQKRITMSGKVINNAGNIYFMITGSKKAAMVKNVVVNGTPVNGIPASFVNSIRGKTIWYIDNEAGYEIS